MLSFLWLSNISLCIYIYHNFSIYSFVSGHLGGFHVLDIANSAAMNIEIHVYFSIMVFSGYMPSSNVAGPRSRNIFIVIVPTYPASVTQRYKARCHTVIWVCSTVLGFRSVRSE